MEPRKLRYFSDVIDAVRELGPAYRHVTVESTGFERGPSYILREHRPRDTHGPRVMFVVDLDNGKTIRARFASGDGLPYADGELHKAALERQQKMLQISIAPTAQDGKV